MSICSNTFKVKSNNKINAANLASSIKEILDTLNNPNATDIEKMAMQAKVAEVALELSLAATELIKSSKLASQLGAVIALQTKAASLTLAMAQYTQAMAQYTQAMSDNSLGSNDKFLKFVDVVGSASGVLASLGVIARNINMMLLGTGLEAFANLLKVINQYSSTGERLPDFTDWYEDYLSVLR